MGDWISVKDRLPEPNIYVLTWFYESKMDGHRCRFAEISCGHWRPEGGNGNFDDRVTHWMPLPTSPSAASSPVVSAPSPCSFDGHMTSQGKCNVKDCHCHACNGVVSETGAQPKWYGRCNHEGELHEERPGCIDWVPDLNEPVVASVLTEPDEEFTPIKINPEAKPKMRTPEDWIECAIFQGKCISETCSFHHPAGHPQDERGAYEEYDRTHPWRPGETRSIQDVFYAGFQAALASRIRK